MDDALLVRSGEALRKLERQLRGFVGPERTGAESFPQCPPFQVLGDDVRLASLLPDVVDIDDVRMAQRTGGASFLLEPTELLFAVRSGHQHLDGDVARQAQVASEEDPSHPAATNLALDDVPLGENQGRCAPIAGFGAALRIRRPRAALRPRHERPFTSVRSVAETVKPSTGIAAPGRRPVPG